MVGWLAMQVGGIDQAWSLWILITDSNRGGLRCVDSQWNKLFPVVLEVFCYGN